VGEAAEVDGVVELRLAGRKALVAAGADGESVPDLDSVERGQEEAEYAGVSIPVPDHDGLAGIGARGPGQLAAVIPACRFRQRRLETGVAGDGCDAATLFERREINATVCIAKMISSFTWLHIATEIANYAIK
jgi:hypothetical protein